VDARDAASLSVAPALVAVLAGGRGERIGGAKPMRELAGRPLIDYPLAAARAAGLQAIVVAKRDTELPDGLAEPLLIEPEEPRHPLCGALAALEHAEHEHAALEHTPLQHAEQGSPEAPVVLVGCDMPFLTGALLAWLAAALEPAILLEAGGRVQPLPARCSAADAPRLREALAAQAPLGETFRSLAPSIVEERALAHFGDPRRLCFSVNSAEDLATAERWLARG
jgi:molybdenum cofactor guanylyltransferase